METDNIISRLRNVYGARNNKELADALETSPGNVSKWKMRNTIPYKEVCETAIKKGVSVEWLLTGKGSQLESPNDYINIPQYNIEASAGYGALVEDDTPSQYIAIKKANLAAAGVNTTNLMIIYARGDSMEPTFNSGDPLFVDRSYHTVAADGGIYVFNYGGDLYVKRLQLSFNGDLLVISDNPKYREMTISKAERDQLNIVGRVAVYGRICA